MIQIEIDIYVNNILTEPKFQCFLLMTISNHVNFEKLLLFTFDTKYRNSLSGNFSRNVASRRSRAKVVLRGKRTLES